MLTQDSSHQTKPKRIRERESGGRLSMDDLSPSPTPGRRDYDEDSEEELLEGERVALVYHVKSVGLA